MVFFLNFEKFKKWCCFFKKSKNLVGVDDDFDDDDFDENVFLVKGFDDNKLEIFFEEMKEEEDDIFYIMW